MPEEIADKRRQAFLEDIKRSRSRFEELQDDVEEAKNRYYEDVRALHRNGMSIRDIANHVGVSHQRVHQILGKGKTRKRASVSKGLGAAGIFLALALGLAALLDEAPRVRTERVTLVQQPALTLNDTRDIKRYEEVVASGRVGGKRWRYHFAHLGGNYCSRFEWVPGPRQQGSVCGALPPHRAPLSDDAIGAALDPVARHRDYNPVPVFYGKIHSQDVGGVQVATCSGAPIPTELVRVRGVEMTLFYAFLPAGTRAALVTAEDLRGEVEVSHQMGPCGSEKGLGRNPRLRGFNGDGVSG